MWQALPVSPNVTKDLTTLAAISVFECELNVPLY